MKRKDGVWITIDRGAVHKRLCKKYMRTPEGLCTKIFDREPSSKIEGYKWGGDWGFDIFDCTRFQNICAFAGLAPRVYALDVVTYKGKRCVAQLTDFVKGEEKHDQSVVDKIIALNDKFGGVRKEAKDYGRNIINGKFVDFQIFSVSDKAYKRYVHKLTETSFWGFHYQSVPGLKGHRDYMTRVNDFQLDGIDFKGQTVVDLGCSNGMFCNYVQKQGGRATGFDLPELIEPAKYLSNYLGNFNIDYLAVDLKDKKHMGKFDIAFFFSMAAHVGIPAWLKDCADVLLFEKSGGTLPDHINADIKVLLDSMKIVKTRTSTDKNREFYYLAK